MPRLPLHAAALAGGLALFSALPAPALAQAAGSVADEIVITAAMEERFTSWLTGFRREAAGAGIAPATFTRSFRGVTIDARVLELNARQPEFVRPIWEYLASALSDQRIADGRAQLAIDRDLFARLESAYGIDRYVLAAIWGLETNYGRIMGDMSVIRSLSTLAFEGRRADFGRSQLIAALKIVQAGDIEPAAMMGSWAGAMGHTQFIPTTYLDYAVDFDGDGARDIWSSRADALASAANYLKASGWETGAAPVREVELPAGFDYALADAGIRKSGEAWMALGVTAPGGGVLPPAERAREAALILPAGHRGPAFLAYPNFRTILRYNNATAYALAVSYLADRLRGGDGIAGTWPTDERPLTLAEAKELQEKLTAIGYDTGGVDGVIGPMTRAGIRGFQAHLGLPQDGFPTASFLEAVRAAAD